MFKVPGSMFKEVSLELGTWNIKPADRCCEFGFLSIEVIKMQKEDYISDPRYSDMKVASRVKMLEEKRQKAKEV